MKLVFLTGLRAGEEVEVTDELVLGREEANLAIEDSAVSRQHARIRATDDGLEVPDLESTNGTFVNGDRITDTQRLEPGDFVTVGETTLEVRDDWKSAATEVIAVPTEEPEDQEEYVPTSPIATPPRLAPPANLRPLLIGVGVAGVLIVLAIWFALRGSDGFAAEVDAVCKKAQADVSDDSIRGDNLATLKPSARRLERARTRVREDLADLEAPSDVAPRYGDFLQRYGDTNAALRRLGTLPRKAKTSQVRRAVDKVRSNADKEAEIAKDLGLKVCGGLPV